MTRLVVASRNKHKIAELRAMLAPTGLEVLGVEGFEGIPEIEETATTFAGNADLKSQGVAAHLLAGGEPASTWVLADDSGVCIDALDGAPGVYSARFAGPQATDADNNRHMSEALAAQGVERSPAHYRCVLSLVTVDGSRGPFHFEGRWDVEIRREAAGQGGFGYDPHAWLPDGRTVAMLDQADKGRLSHRGQALRGLLDWFQAST